MGEINLYAVWERRGEVVLFVTGEMEMEKIQREIGIKPFSCNQFLKSNIVHVRNSQACKPVLQ